MALPDAVKKTLANTLIPFQGIGYASLAAAVVATIATQGFPGNRKLHEVSFKTATLSLGSMLAVVGIQHLLIRDSRKRLEALRQQHPEVEGRRVHRVEVNPTPVVPEERVSFLTGLKREIIPTACVRCQNYHGITYHGEQGANRLICGMHPTGSMGDVCPDWESVPTQYRLIRLQGIGYSNLFFVYNLPGDLSEMMKLAVTVHPMHRDRLMKRYRLKSSSGLPGCRFESQSESIEQAFKELLDSCPE